MWVISVIISSTCIYFILFFLLTLHKCLNAIFFFQVISGPYARNLWSLERLVVEPRLTMYPGTSVESPFPGHGRTPEAVRGRARLEYILCERWPSRQCIKMYRKVGEKVKEKGSIECYLQYLTAHIMLHTIYMQKKNYQTFSEIAEFMKVRGSRLPECLKRVYYLSRGWG